MLPLPLRLLSLVAGLLAAVASAAATEAPHLVHGPAATQLWVNGRPFLVRGGEVRNSSTSSLAYMDPIWPRLTALHLNTVLAPVSWEQLEPVEGQFDFALIDGLLEGARAHRLHLVLLWFGSWKNMVSSYAPSWVRGDPRRFPLTVDDAGNWLPIPSAFGEQTRAADARAFAALMKHLREADAAEQTVIMVQVENEVGLEHSARDRSPAAEAAFRAPVPAELASQLREHPDRLTREFRAAWSAAGGRTSGSWAEIFGAGPVANELFTAWHYARYLGVVAAAGQAEYPLPFFVNAAIGRQDGKIGSYPGGGALPIALDLWHLAAPAIALFSPDIYYGSFSGWCRGYSQSDNPLFIPETLGGDEIAAHALFAIGRWNAIGISPFAIDDRPPTEDEFSRTYGLLEELSPEILAHQADGSIGAALVNRAEPDQVFRLGGYTLKVALRHERKSAWIAASGYVLAIAEQPNRFLIVGRDAEVTFSAGAAPSQVVELGRVEEGAFRQGRWAPGRRLNGDEIMLDYDLSAQAAKNQTGTGLSLDSQGPTVLRVDLLRRDAAHR